MIKRIINSSLAVDLKSEFIAVSGIRLCVLNSDQIMSVAIDTELLGYFGGMFMLPVDIYLISEAVSIWLESAGCQLIVVIEARCVKESVLPLSPTVNRVDFCAVSSVVIAVVLVVIVTVLVTITVISLAVSEMPVDSQLRSILNEAEPACEMMSCGT